MRQQRESNSIWKTKRINWFISFGLNFLLTSHTRFPRLPLPIPSSFSAQLIMSLYEEAENGIHLGNLGFLQYKCIKMRACAFSPHSWSTFIKMRLKAHQDNIKQKPFCVHVMHCTWIFIISIILRVYILSPFWSLFWTVSKNLAPGTCFSCLCHTF